MKNFRNKVLAILMVMVLVLSMAACGKDEEETKDTSGTAETTKDDTNDEGVKSEEATASAEADLEFWSVFTGGDGDAMQAIVDAYNATNPAIKVVHRAIDQNELYQKLPLAVQSGEDVPDIAINHVDRLPLNQENGVYNDMDAFIAANGNIKAENYVSVAWNAGEIGGKRYSIPLDVHGYLTYYNKDLVEKYCPTVLDDNVITFDEIAAVGPTAAADGITTYGITWARPEFLQWYAQLGGKLSDNGTDPSFNNEKGVKVLEDFKKAVENKWCTQDGDDPVQLFGSGSLIFLPEGSWMIGTLNSMGMNYGATYAIAYDATNPQTWASSHQFVMPKKELSEERAAAIMSFIQFVGENSIEWARVGQAPASLKIKEDPEFAAMPQSFLLEKPEFVNISDYKYYGYAVTALDKIVYEVPFGRMEAQAALDQAVQEVADAIKNQ
jgi:multiple sugar transport system substrate-binding protein